MFNSKLRLLNRNQNKLSDKNRLMTEEELRASESRYRGLFENSPISLWEEDFSAVKQRLDDLRSGGVADLKAYLENHPDFVKECIPLVKVVDVNNATLPLFGASSKEELLISLDKILPDDAQDEFLSELIHIANGSLRFEWEGINLTLAGEPIHARLYWSVVPGYEDTLSKVIVSLEDITRQKQTELRLRESEEKHRLLIENIPTGICRTTITGKGTFLMANPALVRMLGYDTEEELKNIAAIDIFAEPSDLQVFAKNLLARGSLKGVELLLKRKNGELLWASVTARVQDDPSNHETYFDCTVTDITERRLAEFQSIKLASKLKTIASVARQISVLKDIDKLSEEVIGSLQEAMDCYSANLFLIDEGRLVFVAGKGGYEPSMAPPKGMEIKIGNGIVGSTAKTGIPIVANDTLTDPHYLHWDGLPNTRSEIAVPIHSGDRLLGIIDLQSTQVNAFDDSDVEALSVLAGQFAVALDNTRLFEQTKHRAQEFEAIFRVSSALRSAVTRADMLAVSLDQIGKLFDTHAAAIALVDEHNHGIHVTLGSGGWASLTGQKLSTEAASWEYVIATGKTYCNNYINGSMTIPATAIGEDIRAMACVPLISQEMTIGALAIGRHYDISEEDLRALIGIGDMIANAIQRSSLYEKTQQHADLMVTVSSIGRSLAETLNIEEIYARLAQAVLDLYPDIAAVLISEFDPSSEMITCAYGLSDGQRIEVTELPPLPLAPQNQGTQSWVIRERKPLIVDDLPNKLTIKYTLGKANRESQSAVYAPLLAKGEVLGLIQVQSYSPARFTKGDAELLMLIANTGAIAIENARLFAEIRQRMLRMSALRTMDMAISSSFDLRVTLNVLLDQVTSQLGVDAACILLYNVHSRTLEYTAGRGFRSVTNSPISLRLDQSLAGRAALERRVIHIPNLRSTAGTRPLLHSILEENFISYYATPLLAKGQVKGVLEIYNHTSLNPDAEWKEYLETLAGDAAIAIDNATMFNDLQRSNVELTLAYDRTLEGWSRALELRDEETEGHAHRVNEMTLKLAVAMGVGESELQHIRRGALLHDIGKMGVPDQILHKPGPLSEEEWEIMRLHPVHAYELLSRIPYLKPALDIPYCHHERWDGTGYPNGLKGEEIPLSARIFAAVDVWDALLSKRPYRDAWPEEKVISYLGQESGKHFDPVVIDRFLHLLGKR
jgi:PAS domain S-box-containing protein